MLAERRRIALDRPVRQWINEALRSDDRLSALPLDAETAVRAAQLGSAGFHDDPADRFIYATARSLGGTLVTRDAAMLKFDPASTVW